MPLIGVCMCCVDFVGVGVGCGAATAQAASGVRGVCMLYVVGVVCECCVLLFAYGL